MKIDELHQNSAASYAGNTRADRPETAEAHGEAVAKQHAATDKVKLSRYIAVVAASEGRQDVRANKVAEIKSQIDSGSYQVSSRAVAEKMLSRLVTGTAH